MRKNKYNVGDKKKRTVGGKVFMSIKEANRYVELLELEKKGAISELELQPRFILQLGFTDSMGEKHREIAYIADFRYMDNKTKELTVEDVKGMKTDIYKIKKKLLLYSYQDFRFIES